MDKYLSYVNPRTNIKGFLIAILVLGVLGLGVGAAVVTNPGPDDTVEHEELVEMGLSSPHTLIYGFWSGDTSEIRAFNLSDGKDSNIASLPFNVKHVKLISPSEISYINDTDDSDYGSNITIRNFENQTDRVVAGASSDVRIDDYRISPNGQYIATWEVARPADSNQLYGGLSRVYLVDITTGEKKQIYSETATTPVHYPVAVTDSGRVFMDSFLPNEGAGWAYGMSYADFSNPTPQNIPTMTNGTYGSQPVMSTDGVSLVFTGYDGTKGSGTESINGSRRAIISANSVETLDTSNLQRTKLSNLSNQNYYPKAAWDDVTGDVVFSMISSDYTQTGTYLYSLNITRSEKVGIPFNSNINITDKLISSLASGLFLLGSVTDEEGTLGNLGSNYENLLDKIYILKDDEKTKLSLESGFVQVIAIKNNSYLGDLAVSSNENQGVVDSSVDRLQLDMFTIKPTLAPKRSEQQSNPPSNSSDPRNPEGKDTCSNMAIQACLSQLGYSSEEQLFKAMQGGSYAPGSGIPDEEHWAAVLCYKEQVKAATHAGCYDSPLYLYAPEGLKVNVKVGTKIYNSNINYSSDRGYNLALNSDGSINSDGVLFDSVEFDYVPSFDAPVLTYGLNINSRQVESTFEKFANDLGLNEKETSDTIKKAKELIGKDDAFVSYYTQEVSKKILPLYFSPEPDNYYNTVFYIKKLDNLSNRGPVGKFPEPEKIKRTGFTAIEISFKVE